MNLKSQFSTLILFLLPLLLPAKSPAKRVAVGLDDDGFLQLLEVEIARTLRSELSSDDELQNLEGSGGDASAEEDEYLKKADPITLSTSTSQEPYPTTTIPEPTTTTTTTTTAPSTITTTTEKPTTTTAKPTKPKVASSQPQCVFDQECFKDSECPGGKCLGSELGVCDCNACVTNRKCSTDLDCGGLRNSCDPNGYCDCVKAFHSHGFELFVKVLLTFCHQTKCTQDTDNCYGLPCRVGKCKCAPASRSNLPVHYFKPGGK
ncbi:hypothetical protein CAEBREN_32065 [Caenorhabditis brenneri]|uniref:Uncharacterized protein n=1 Tax=Caenorhabditis brenneri TaxID=135651 RepID=G0PIA2_CAEBE|nr:hypothetical protein CAEBREN_32065 [Caenorhabditis brenneri]